jgi:hypothetical protein
LWPLTEIILDFKPFDYTFVSSKKHNIHMNKKFLGLSAFMAAVFFTFSFTTNPANDIESLAIGAAAPKTDLKMSDISGKAYSLSDLKKENGLLVIFSCNGCPFVVGAEGYGEGWEGRYPELQKLADEKKIGMVLVNSNEAKRDKGDNLEDMKARAKEHGFGSSKYVYDKNSELANAFGARTTPHVFLFDKNMKLIYKGAIDDNNESASKVTKTYLKDAMQSAAAGKAVSVSESKPVGCSIKRVTQ